MAIVSVAALWRQTKVLRSAFSECRIAMEDVFRQARRLVCSSPGGGVFGVRFRAAPRSFYTARRHIFSSLFQAVYSVLGVSRPRRLLYARINYLFRIWVTSADNLLDNDDKMTVPLELPGGSRVMKQVVAVMAADRLLARFLRDAETQRVITSAEAALLSDDSLRILLPSAAEEASEEGGVCARPDAEYVLSVIHRLKTGMLFQIPFLGPDRIEHDIDRRKLKDLKRGLMDFGLGCQIIDDLRDVSRDYLEKRHNYVLSLHARMPGGRSLDILRGARRDDKAASVMIEASRAAARRADGLIRGGFAALGEAGISFCERDIAAFSRLMFVVLGVNEALAWL